MIKYQLKKENEPARFLEKEINESNDDDDAISGKMYLNLTFVDNQNRNSLSFHTKGAKKESITKKTDKNSKIDLENNFVF